MEQRQAEAMQVSQVPRSDKVFSFIHEADVAKIPPPEWLIEGVLPARAFAVLYGPSGLGKSYLAKDWAFHIAAGTRWAGHPVKQGEVIYVAAEGIEGYGPRIAAWKAAHGIDNSLPVHFGDEGVQLTTPSEVRGFIASVAAKGYRPSVIVLDTLARCFVGENETDAKAMGKLVEAADELRRATGATVLIVHHTTKNGDEERGSYALRSGLDAMMSLSSARRREGELVLACEKMRHAKKFDAYKLRLKPFADSCVIEVLADAGEKSDERPLSAAAANALALLPEAGAANKVWLSSFLRDSGQSESTFNRARRELMGRGLVQRVSRLYRRPEPPRVTATSVTLFWSDSVAPNDAERRTMQPHAATVAA